MIKIENQSPKADEQATKTTPSPKPVLKLIRNAFVHVKSDVRNWLIPLKALYHRFRDPLGRPKALIYFGLAIALFGALELWGLLTLNYFGIAHPRDVAISFTTYAITICGTAVVDASIDERIGGTMRIVLLAGALIIAVLSGYHGYLVLGNDGIALSSPSTHTLPPRVEFALIVQYLIPAWLVWWMVSANDERFSPDTDARTAAGGDPLSEI